MAIKVNTMALIVKLKTVLKNTKSRANWKVVYDFLERNLLKPSLNHTFAKGGFNDSSWDKFR